MGPKATLSDCIQQQVSVDTATLERLTSAFEARELEKGSFLLRSGQLCRTMAFVESGFLRMYDWADGQEVTLWIGGPGRFITSLSSFIFQTPNHWTIEALTPVAVQVISRDKHLELYRKEPKWLEFDNRLLAHSFAQLERRLFAHLHTTAEERLKDLLADYPELFQEVPLRFIASMLGIAPESLSRLRRKLAKADS